MAFSPETFSVSIGLALFLLALLYCFADFSSVFDKNSFIEKYNSAFTFAFTYFAAFITIMFKVMLVLLFIYVFIVIYNIAIVGIFKPLISENMDSNASVSGFSSAREIVDKARISYYESIKAIAKKTMDIAFGFIKIPNCLLLTFVLIPTYILIVTYSYYAFIGTKVNIKSNQQKVLSTNYHYFIILIFTIMMMLSLYLIYIVLDSIKK